MIDFARISGEVLVVGDVMTDIIALPEGPLVVGSDRRAKITTTAGGSGANQAVWLASMGVPVALFACVGAQDKPQLDAEFDKSGVRSMLAPSEMHQSGRLISIVSPDGERSFLTDAGASRHLTLKSLPENWWDGIGLLQISGYALFAEKPREAVQHMIEVARSKNIPVSVDPGSTGFLKEVGPKTFLNWIGAADFIFANTEEAALLSGAESLQDQVSALAKQFATVVVKLGGDGAIAGSALEITEVVSASAVPVVDTTGAGDAFLSGFIAANIAGESLLACLQAGNSAGARAVQQIGGRPTGVK